MTNILKSFLNMRIWIPLFLVIAHSVAHADTILSQGARNIKTGLVNGVPYGGAIAKGDGVTDDTQAFLDALNLNRGMATAANNKNGCDPLTIYVPPGRYKVSSTIIIWDQTVIFGEPSSRPTIFLASGSMTSGSNPFIVTTPSNAKPAYSKDWFTRGGGTDPVTGGATLSSNNLFNCYIRDINFAVESDNPGCSYVVWWSTAQGSGFRNSVLTATSSQSACLGVGLDIGPAGGGQTIDNITTNGGAKACAMGNYFILAVRNCTFNGEVDNGGVVNDGGVRGADFITCKFNNPGGIGLNNQTLGWSNVDDCSFTANTQYQGAGSYHLENVFFGSANTSPSIPAGTCVQYTSGTVYLNGAIISGSSSSLNASGIVRPKPIPTTAYPYPGASCVNVKTLGINPNGSGDQAPAINAALQTHNELFFPIGDYEIDTPIKLGPGQHLFGGGASYFPGALDTSVGYGQTALSGNANPIISTTGNGTGNGVIITSMSIASTGSNTCLVWNADPSSVVIDCDVSPTSTGLSMDCQSGGGLFEGGIWSNEAGPNAGAATGFKFESTGSVYMIGISVQEYTGTAVIMKGAQNVYWAGLDGENSTLEIQITNCADIWISGENATNDSNILPSTVTVSNSRVSLWGTSCTSFPTGFTNMVGENGIGYGSGALAGYVDASTN